MAVTLVNIGLMPVTGAPDSRVYEPELMSELLSIGAALESRDIGVEFRDYALSGIADPLSRPTLLADFLEGSADRIIIHIYHFFLPFVILAAKEVKSRWPRKEIVLAGKGPTPVAPLILESFPWIDGVICGEGEEPALAWAMGQPYEEIPGFCHRQDGSIFSNCSKRKDSIDGLRPPAYHHARVQAYSQVHVLASRGCLHGCTYCYNRTYWGHKRSVRPVKDVVQEFALLHRHYGIREIILEDDNFILGNREWALDFCGALMKERLEVTWVALCRADQVDEGLLGIMGKSGCSHIILGMETGSDFIMKKTGKNITVAQALRAVALSSRAIPHVLVPFMWGFPFETMDDLLQTIQVMSYIHEYPGASVRLNMVVPLPGTALTEEHKDEIFFTPDMLPFNKSKYYLKPSMIDLVRSHRVIFSSFYTFKTPELEKKALLLRHLLPCGAYVGTLSPMESRMPAIVKKERVGER
jgi:radical SAM superfamily enzyme YgiQ (UPF0313 family)